MSKDDIWWWDVTGFYDNIRQNWKKKKKKHNNWIISNLKNKNNIIQTVRLERDRLKEELQGSRRETESEISYRS